MSSRFFQGSFLFLTFLFINIGYYLYQLVLGKYMSVEDFGMMSTLFAIQFLLSIPVTVIGSVVLRHLPLYQDDMGKKQEFIMYMLKKLLIFSGFFIVLGFSGSAFIASYLHLPSPYLVVLVITTVALLMLVVFFRTILYAEKKFLVFGVNNILEIIFRILVSLLLIKWGFGYEMIYSMYLIGMCGVLVSLWPYLKQYLTGITLAQHTFDTSDVKKQLLPMTLLAVMLTLYGNIEIIIAKRYLAIDEIAHLGSAFLMGKIILAGLGLFQGVASPYFLKTRENLKYLIAVYGCFMVSGFVAVLLYSYFPDTIIRILFTAEYMSIMPSLGKVAVIMGILALFSLVWNHMIIAGKRYISYCSCIPLVGIMVTSNFFPPTSLHGYIETLFYTYILSAGILCVVVVGIEYVSIRHKLLHLFYTLIYYFR